MNNRDKCFLAYTAGLIDGEGTITIGRESRYKNNQKKEHRDYWYYRPTISIAMTDALSVALIKDYFEKKSIKSNFWLLPRQTDNRKDVYRIDFQDQTSAYEFIKTIQPFLLIKYEQAKVLSSFLVFVRKWKAKGRNCYNEKFQSKCFYYYNIIHNQHKECLNRVNSVKLLDRLDLRQYRSKREDVESARKNVDRLLEGVETKLSASTRNKAISALEKDIVHN